MILLPLAAALALPALAAGPDPERPADEHITLRNGFELDCVRREASGERVRLYLSQGNYIEVPGAQILRIDALPDATPVAENLPATSLQTHPAAPHATYTREELHPLLAEAGGAHNIDADLLWSVVKAESAGNPQAVSRAGAKGLMQLMPTTASTLGVADSFAPRQNIAGGAAYLDQMLTRYHDDMALALAAYNAGPQAVDRYHGIPPYRETRQYVARVIAEFNNRKRAAQQQATASIPQHPAAH